MEESESNKKVKVTIEMVNLKEGLNYLNKYLPVDIYKYNSHSPWGLKGCGDQQWAMCSSSYSNSLKVNEI